MNRKGPMRRLGAVLTMAVCLPLAFAEPAHAQSASFTPQAARITPLGGSEPERLLDMVSTVEKIPVIVGVRIDGDWRPIDGRKPETADAQRQKIKEAKAKVLRAHPAARKIADRDYASIPYFALEVDEKALRNLMADDDITSIEESRVGERTLVESTAVIGSRTANLRGYDGSGQAVIILDDGVQSSHPFIYGAIYPADQACFSGANSTYRSVCPNGQTTMYGAGAGEPCPFNCNHGTSVGGIVAGASPQNNMYGVAPESYLYSIQIFSASRTSLCGGVRCTLIDQMDLIAALQYVYTAVLPYYNYAAVNMSFRLTGTEYLTRSACDNAFPSVRAAIQNIVWSDVAVVAGAGNDGATGVNSPACISNVIAVGATADNDYIAAYSNRSSMLDFFAPGGQGKPVAGGWQLIPGQGIWSSIPGGGYAEAIGTSFSAPHVAGAFAVLRDRYPRDPINSLYYALRATGTMIYANGGPIPRINLNAALDHPH